MSSRRPLDGGLALQAEATRYEQVITAVYKFRFFFVGLVFAMLSFAMQYPVSTTILSIKLTEFLSWFFLIFTGFLALRDCGGFSANLDERAVEGLTPFWRSVMWKAFLVAVLLLFAAKAMDANFKSASASNAQSTSSHRLSSRNNN